MGLSLRSQSFEAFDSPNMRPLIVSGAEIQGASTPPEAIRLTLL